MKTRDRICIMCAIAASLSNILLLQAILPASPIYGKDSVIMIIGAIGFCVALISIYLGIPYYDDDSNMKRPLNRSLFSGIILGVFNLIGVLILTPGVLIIWGSGSIQKIVASLL